MRKIICDRCGAEITGERIGYLAATWKSRSDDSFMQPSPYEDYDFCEACMKDVISVIDFDIIPAPPEPEPEPEPEEEPVEDPEEEEVVQRIAETKAPARKGVNYTRLRELVKAGKTPKEISEELGITTKQYYYARKRAEQLYVAGAI